MPVSVPDKFYLFFVVAVALVLLPPLLVAVALNLFLYNPFIEIHDTHNDCMCPFFLLPRQTTLSGHSELNGKIPSESVSGCSMKIHTIT